MAKKNKQTGWPKINMDPETQVCNHQGFKNLTEAREVINGAAYPLGWNQASEQLKTGRGSIVNSRKE